MKKRQPRTKVDSDTGIELDVDTGNVYLGRLPAFAPDVLTNDETRHVFARLREDPGPQTAEQVASQLHKSVREVESILRSMERFGFVRTGWLHSLDTGAWARAYRILPDHELREHPMFPLVHFPGLGPEIKSLKSKPFL